MGPKLPSQARGRLLPWDGLSGPRGTPPDAVPASLGFVQTWELTSVQEAPAPSGPAPPVNLTETAAASAQLLLLPSGLALLQQWPPIPTLAPTGSHGKEDSPGNQTPPRLPHQRFRSLPAPLSPHGQEHLQGTGRGPLPESPPRYVAAWRRTSSRTTAGNMSGGPGVPPGSCKPPALRPLPLPGDGYLPQLPCPRWCSTAHTLARTHSHARTCSMTKHTQ